MLTLTNNKIDISITFAETGEFDNAREILQRSDDQAEADAPWFADDCQGGADGAVLRLNHLRGGGRGNEW